MPPSMSSQASYHHSEELRLHPTVHTHRYHHRNQPHRHQRADDDDHHDDYDDDDDDDDDDEETVWRTVLEVDVASVAWSTLHLPNDGKVASSATPFPRIASDLMLSYGLEKLLVQSSSSSLNSFSPPRDAADPDPTMIPDAEIGTPIGLSVAARFHHRSSSTSDAPVIEDYDEKWEALLRTLSGSLLGCGSSHPFDSMREKRHQHVPYHNPKTASEDLGSNGVHSFEDERRHIDNSTTVLEYRAVIPTSEGAGTSTCVDGINSFLSLLPCSHRRGFFGAGPTPDLLAGSDVKGSRMWIDATASASCFDAGVTGGGCELALRQGMSYTKIVDTSSSSSFSAPRGNANVSLTFKLGELLRTPKEDARYRREMEACPLADDSVVRTYPPTYVDHHRYPQSATTTTTTTMENLSIVEFGYPAKVSRGENPTENECQEGSDQYDAGEENKGFASHNILDIAGGVDLSRQWISIPVEYEHLRSPSSSSCVEESIPSSAGYNTDVEWRIDRVLKKVAGLVGVGSLETVLRNGDTRCSVEVSSVDLFPKIIKPILYSIDLQLYEGGGAGGASFHPLSSDTARVSSRRLTLDTMKHHQLILAKDGSASLHLTTEIPPDSSLWVSMQYNPRFLSFEDFPADPNRGVDLPPSYATFSSGLHALGNSAMCRGGAVGACSPARPAECLPCRVTLHSPSLLLMPPLPDMSMPFNVISLTCTVYAFVIGTMINLLVRRSSGSINKAMGKGEASKDKISKQRAVLRKMFRKRSTSSKVDELKHQ